MSTPALMVQGTASHAGKSTLAAGLCRLLRQQGYRVAPFKAQNMSLNSAAAIGGEIGRAQAVQAAACGLVPTVDMNPILLKPTGRNDCQLVVQGRARGLRSSQEYGQYPAEVIAAIRESYARLAASADVVVLEGAGSPAEINLLDRDFANMWMADVADAPVILVGDIERGGVFASLYGTWLLAPQRQRIRGFVLNKFRGDPALLGSGPRQLRALTGVPTLGVVPYFDLDLPEEDSLGLPARVAAPGPGHLRIGILRLPHISNFTDFEPLRRQPEVALEYVWEARELAACDVLILPGTKSTAADLLALRQHGLDRALRHAALVEKKPILGICGGYQMLGERIADPERVESAEAELEGLGLLPVRTRFEADKRVGEVQGRLYLHEIKLAGYFIQHGRVTRHGGEPLAAWERPGDEPELDGCVHDRIWGVSAHGLFDSAAFYAHALSRWRAWAGRPAAAATVPDPGVDSLDQRLDRWAEFLRQHLDLPAVLACAGLKAERE